MIAIQTFTYLSSTPLDKVVGSLNTSSIMAICDFAGILRLVKEISNNFR